MHDMTILLSVWLASLYAVGLFVGYVARLATCTACSHQERAYRRELGTDAPPMARRAVANTTGLAVVFAMLLVGVVGEVFGLRPPGAQGFTFWAYLILVMPGCMAGAAWGAALAVSKGPLPHWAIVRAKFIEEVEKRPGLNGALNGNGNGHKNGNGRNGKNGRPKPSHPDHYGPRPGEPGFDLIS